jgi:hypothetical protein
MRLRLLPLFLMLLASCRTPTEPPPPAPEPTRDEVLAAAARDLAAGSHRGEAVLAAAGQEAVPFVRPLVDSDDPVVGRKALRLLLDSGEDIPLSVEERVGLLLSEASAPEDWPYASLRALAALREMGESAEPALRRAAQGEGPEAEAARRLLSIEE